VQYNNSSAFGGISGFTTDGTRVTASTTIGVGAATPSTSGSGVTFPATQSASTNVNTLDDYEEGTWTPTLTDGTNFAPSGGQNSGSYTKIGNQVTLCGYLRISGLGSVSGNVSVGGLPFPPAQYAGGGVGWGAFYSITAGQSVSIFATSSYTTRAELYIWNSTSGGSNMTATQFTGSGLLGFTLTYLTTT
jgi:hypothetical protein